MTAKYTQQGHKLIDDDPLLAAGEVAKIFKVDPKTVARWASGGKLAAIRTPGGHRRFRQSEVQAFLDGKSD